MQSESILSSLTGDSPLEQGASAGGQSAATAPGEVSPAEPGELESVSGVSVTDSTGRNSPGVLQPGADNASRSNQTGLAVTFVNASETKAVLYATDFVQTGAETGGGDKILHVAWKVNSPFVSTCCVWLLFANIFRSE